MHTKKHIKSLFAGLVTGLLALAFSGCNDSDSNGAATGPSGAGAFSGASISFNPTVNFLAGNTLTYLNTEVGSPFPAAAVATAGTYTYTPNASFTQGTLTMNVTGITDPIVLDISSFTRNGTNVTGFTARSGGQSYPVTVTGTITAYQPAPSGGGSTGETRAADIPSAMQGSHVLTFHKSETTAISGVPADGTETTFTIGARTLAFNGRTLTDPVFYNGNTLEWLFKDGSIWWAVSQAVGGGLNEINVQGPYSASSVAFYGQYNDRADEGGGGSVSVDGDGKFVAGSIFYATLNTKTGPDTVPSTPHLSTPNVPETGQLKFEIANNGDLIVGDSLMVIPYSAADITAVTYVQVLTGNPLGTNTVTISKNTTTNAPTNVSIYIVRNQVTPSVKTTQVTYTFTPVPAE
ncbi:hypothetical protein [Rariglobus hedericola]|uniref:Uncharacterized protein n=1 Tax=Rariglobus hedericola TaxID=2597822 RepID=A0A556QEJ8_9BACT|nr:hypothetical protein [Rariglobus hedericola]TSJ75031.1 hypothetical protein FPL22_16670 [Rariglobus hedericola]